ncbi:MAG: hypothetical protein JSR71_03895 [Proteobacteria bacterium]|nr:hypothetical protein [Pseudomonadota bacterium]
MVFAAAFKVMACRRNQIFHVADRQTVNTRRNSGNNLGSCQSVSKSFPCPGISDRMLGLKLIDAGILPDD